MRVVDSHEKHPDEQWFLPRHSVTNINKPGKVRCVTNAASMFKGRSLNNDLLKGPDLLTSLQVSHGSMARGRSVSVANERFLNEYVPTLQKRSKWSSEKPNLEVGDLVWLLKDYTPRGVWPVGRVLDTNISKDGLVRTVRIRTSKGDKVCSVTAIKKLTMTE